MRPSKVAVLFDNSYLKGEFSRKMINGKTRCARQTTKKYKSRSSPPYPANDCCGLKKVGNDGATYVSVPNAKGVCRWTLYKKKQ